MLRTIILIYSVFLVSNINAQKDSLSITAMLGFGGGLPIFQSIEEQSYAVNLISQTRDNSTQLRLGIRLDLDKKNKLELFYKRTRFKLDEDKLPVEYKKYNPDHFFYPAYTLGNQTTQHRYALNSFELHYGYLFEKNKTNFYPYIGLGAGLWRHSDFYYLLRNNKSNYATEYEIQLKTNIRPTYSFGLRFGIKRLPAAYLDLSFHGGQNKYSYDINVIPQNPSESIFSTKIDYNRFVHSINLVLVLALI